MHNKESRISAISSTRRKHHSASTYDHIGANVHTQQQLCFDLKTDPSTNFPLIHVDIGDHITSPPPSSCPPINLAYSRIRYHALPGNSPLSKSVRREEARAIFVSSQ